MESNTSPDYRAVTERQQAAWATGDFHKVARQVVGVSEALVQAADPRPGQRVLDIACGSGNAALVASRRYCEVTGLDFVPALIDRAKQRAAAEGLPVDFRVGDAQALPFPDASFDVVLSTFGVMFAPDQEKAASELLRVCRPGGKIGLATWPPEGMVAEFFRIMSQYVPPPPGLKPPTRWGTEAGLGELLGAGTGLQLESRRFFQYFLSVEHMFETFKTYFGPTARAFQSLDASGQESLRREMFDSYNRYNRATDGTVMLESQYVQAVATRK
jgi:ubiquinone/menaquinone biosynthesis C-methylase UbiE